MHRASFAAAAADVHGACVCGCVCVWACAQACAWLCVGVCVGALMSISGSAQQWQNGWLQHP